MWNEVHQDVEEDIVSLLSQLKVRKRLWYAMRLSCCIAHVDALPSFGVIGFMHVGPSLIIILHFAIKVSFFKQRFSGRLQLSRLALITH